MKKKNFFILVLILVLAVIIILLAFFLMQKQDSSNNVSGTKSTTESSYCDSKQGLMILYCYENLSISKNDMSICENIRKNVDSNLTSQWQGACMSTFALQKGDVALCDKIPFYFSKNTCYWWMAHNTKNPSLCDKIDTNFEAKSTCLENAK